ncbi:EamA family transporter [Granulicoccus sp. GXG6511]|uniref:EamA family transporter n=1 Tax=Granulicoccus sp. GXG6511 TaxID=3381351 RepID=UPI003D7D72C2
MEATRVRDVLLTTIAPITWGSTYFVTRQWLPADIPLTGAAIRALPAGLILLLIARKLPEGEWWWRTAIISALTVGGFFILIYVAGIRLPSGVAATLMAASAVVMLVFARLLLGERAGPIRYAGGVAGVLGVALLVGGASSGLDPLGLMAALLAMISTTLGFVLVKRWRPPAPPLTFAAWQLTLGGLMIVPFALALEGPPPAMDAPAVLGFAYLVLIATALAYAAWFTGLRRLPAGTVGLIGLLNPLSGALLGTLAAGEVLTPIQLVGAVIILAGVAAGIDWRVRRRK